MSSRFQIKCTELEKQNKLLISQYNSLDTEKKDVTEYLKRTLSEKEDEADDLLQRLEAQRQAAVQEKQSLQLKHDKLRQELDAQINELNEKNAVLGEAFYFKITKYLCSVGRKNNPFFYNSPSVSTR